MSFLDKASKDRRVKRLLEQLSKGQYYLDLDKLELEAENLHASKRIRQLKTEDLIQSFQKKFIAAALQNQAYRSRLVEIKSRCFRTSAKLEEHLSYIRPYLRTKYPKSLANHRTVADKNAAIDTVLEEPVRYLRRLNSMDKMLEELIKDTDQSQWAMKSLIDAMAFNKDKEIKF